MGHGQKRGTGSKKETTPAKKTKTDIKKEKRDEELQASVSGCASGNADYFVQLDEAEKEILANPFCEGIKEKPPLTIAEGASNTPFDPEGLERQSLQEWRRRYGNIVSVSSGAVVRVCANLGRIG